jgi:hypothetical protein
VDGYRQNLRTLPSAPWLYQHSNPVFIYKLKKLPRSTIIKIRPQIADYVTVRGAPLLFHTHILFIKYRRHVTFAIYSVVKQNTSLPLSLTLLAHYRKEPNELNVSGYYRVAIENENKSSKNT